VAEVGALVEPLDEAALVALRAVVLAQARQQREQAFHEARDFVALLLIKLLQVEPHQEHEPVAVDVRSGQRAYAIYSHLGPRPCSSTRKR
jgi:hypothetical protein